MSFVKQAVIDSSGDIVHDCRELQNQLHDKAGFVFLFLPSEFCQDILANEMEQLFECPVACCSAASTICHGRFEKQALVAMSFASSVCQVKTFFVENVCDVNGLEKTCQDVTSYVSELTERDKLLSVFLADGLSHQEDLVVHLLSSALSGVPVVGGSSSDDLKFKSAPLYYRGRFYENAAALFILKLSIDFSIFKVEHFYPTDQRVVVTKADPEKRIISEIDGQPAAERYAALIGKKKDELDLSDFSSHPFALYAAGEVYIRSVDNYIEADVLRTYGAIHEGVVFRLAQSEDIDSSTLSRLNDARSGFEEVYGTLGFECILRKEELMYHKDDNVLKNIFNYYEQYRLIGCHTYGEQFLGHHVNQSLVGVIFGRKSERKRS